MVEAFADEETEKIFRKTIRDAVIPTIAFIGVKSISKFSKANIEYRTRNIE